MLLLWWGQAGVESDVVGDVEERFLLVFSLKRLSYQSASALKLSF